METLPRGHIDIESASSSISSTLDEPILDTVRRDLGTIYEKLVYVLKPRSRAEAGSRLRSWDLWGPLILCLFLSVVLYLTAGNSLHLLLRDENNNNNMITKNEREINGYIRQQQRLAFSLVYVFVCIGSCIVTFNAQLLGGKISFFQSVCVLGYCLFPLDIAAFLCAFFPTSIRVLKLVVCLVALHWSTGASVAFMSEMICDKRKTLAIYPVWLFYITIAWIICSV